jgi:dipeptidyl aminopeptidase/acylaminoacyl peptidase
MEAQMKEPPMARRIAALALLACAALSGSATASGSAAAPPAPAAPLPIEAFFGPEELGEIDLSPSGRWLAVGVQPAGLRRGLALYDLHGSEPPRELARFADMDIGDFHWVGDDRLVFDVLDTHRGSGDQRRGSGLFSVHRDGSDLTQHVLMQWSRNPGQGTRASRRLDATHALSHVPRQQTPGAESVIVRGARHPNAPFGDWVLKRLNIVSGQVQALNAAEPADVRRTWFDAAGHPVLALAQADGRMTVHERGRDANGALTRSWTRLLTTDALDAPWQPHSLDRLGRLYVTQPQGPNGEAVLKRFDRSRGQPEPAALAAVPGFDFTGRLIEEEADGADPVLGIRVLTDDWTTVWLHPELAALQQVIDARLPGRSNVLTCRRCREADRTVVVVSSADRQPGEIWLWRGAVPAPTQAGASAQASTATSASTATAWRRIGASRPAIDPQRMAEVGFTRFAARDGLEIPLWVTMPPGLTDPARAPAVVLVHGGPWVRGGRWGWSPMQQFLASRGYVVLEPEFRGSTGYGDKLYRAGWQQWGRAMQDDLADAVQWAVQRGLVDPGRVCIAGGSYGGYAALMGLVRQADVFRCAAAWVPLTDVRWLLREGSPDDWSDETRSALLPRLLADRLRDSALITQISPIEQVQHIQAPVLLAWGEEDTRTPPAQAQALHRALVAAGREPQAVGYKGEGHSWLQTATRVDFARRLEAFLAASLQPVAAGTTGTAGR